MEKLIETPNPKIVEWCAAACSACLGLDVASSPIVGGLGIAISWLMRRLPSLGRLRDAEGP